MKSIEAPAPWGSVAGRSPRSRTDHQAISSPRPRAHGMQSTGDACSMWRTSKEDRGGQRQDAEEVVERTISLNNQRIGCSRRGDAQLGGSAHPRPRLRLSQSCFEHSLADTHAEKVVGVDVSYRVARGGRSTTASRHDDASPARASVELLHGVVDIPRPSARRFRRRSRRRGD